MDKIGFIGLGAMGRPMAWNIHRAGYPLSVYNRGADATEEFSKAGVTVCASPREIAGRSDVIIVMVTGPEALLEVITGEEGIAAGITAGKTVVNMSTVSPEATDTAAAALRAKGADFVDAPVSGSLKPAQEATLVILAGADPAPLGRVTPLLKTLGTEVIDCGGIGQGTRMKLVLNLLLGNMMQSLAEALVTAKNFGLGLPTVLTALARGAMNAPLFQAKGQAILEGHFAPQFPVHLMFKDLNLLLETAGRARTPLPQTAATRECFSAAMAKGLGEEDMAAVVKVLEGLTGRPIRD